MIGKKTLLFITIGLVAILAATLLQVTNAYWYPRPSTDPKPSIVLVHGAWADGSSWQNIIPILQKDGYNVTAVQLPETSLADDIVTAQRVIDDVGGPVVLVAHSYGGAVTTGAAVGRDNVKALVYISAFAPDVNESLSTLIGMFAPTPLLTALVPDASGFFYINRTQFPEVFAQDVKINTARIMAVTQKPIAGAILVQNLSAAAWKTIPSWYLVTTQDRCVNPDLQRFLANRMGAQISEVNASHASIISRPGASAKVIEDAARNVSSTL